MKRPDLETKNKLTCQKLFWEKQRNYKMRLTKTTGMVKSAEQTFWRRRISLHNSCTLPHFSTISRTRAPRLNFSSLYTQQYKKCDALAIVWLQNVKSLSARTLKSGPLKTSQKEIFCKMRKLEICNKNRKKPGKKTFGDRKIILQKPFPYKTRANNYPYICG